MSEDIDTPIARPGGGGGLGRLPARDDRDHRFLAMPRAVVAATPVGLLRRRWFYNTKTTLDQGATPMCVGFGWKKILMLGPVVNRAARPTPQEIYAGAQDNDEWPGSDYAGSSVRGGAKWLQAQGYLTGYAWAFDAAAVATYLLSTGPMALGTDWHDAMFQPDAAGFIQPGGGIAGGHCYAATGVDLDKHCPDGTTGAVRCDNSWGAAWGAGGRFWLSLAALGVLLRNEGEACAAVEIHKPPKRRVTR